MRVGAAVIGKLVARAGEVSIAVGSPVQIYLQQNCQ